MNCQYCGKKIGILENWRYGRFCSKEHQEEFREEANRLAASVLGGRLGSSSNAPAQVAEALNLSSRPAQTVAGDAVAPPEPPQMEAVEQVQPAPVRWKARVVAPPPAASERDQKSLRILASIDRPAPPVLEKDSRRKLVVEDSPYRFGELTAKGTRSVLVPPSGAVQRRPKLLFHDALFPLDARDTSGTSPEFECIWQGDASWSPEDTGTVALDYGDYLGEYTPEAPWQDWNWDALLEEAKYAQALAAEREKHRNQTRSQRPEQGPQGRPGSEPRMPEFPARATTSTYPPARQQAPQPAGGLRPVMPGLNSAPAGQSHTQASPALRVPLQGGVGRPSAGATLSYAGGTGTATLPAMPSYPGRMALRPVSSGSGGKPGASSYQGLAVGHAGMAVSGDSTPMEWVELAPPLFLALCKIDDPAPMGPHKALRTPEIEHLTPVSEASFTSGDNAIRTATAEMPGIACELLMVALRAPIAPSDAELKIAIAQPFPAAVVCEIPVRRPSARLFALPVRRAGARVVLNLRPVPLLERPLPACRLAG